MIISAVLGFITDIVLILVFLKGGIENTLEIVAIVILSLCSLFYALIIAAKIWERIAK